MDKTKDLLRRSRNLLSHPPLWWKDNEASRERLIAELDAALAEPERKPLNEDQMNEAYIHIWRNLPDGFGHTASEWIDVGVRYAERAHGIISTEVNGDKS